MNYEAIVVEKDAIIALLQQGNGEQQQRYVELQQSHIELQQNYILQLESYAQLRSELEQLKKMIYGSKRERFIQDIDIHQLSLFNPDPSEEIIAPVEEQKQNISYERKVAKKHPGRNEFPDHLPVTEVILEPEEGTEGMIRIGEEVTETLDYTPGSLVRRRTVRPKYVKPSEGTIHIAKAPSKPFPKYRIEVTLMAYMWVSKFVDHIPFYRQILRFWREY